MNGPPPAQRLRMTDSLRSATEGLISQYGYATHTAVRRPSDQTVATSTTATIDFTSGATIEENREGMFSTADPTRITAKRPGIYIINGYVSWDADADGLRLLTLEVNGAVVAGTRATPGTNTGYYQTVTTTLRLTKGQYVTMSVRHNAGNDLAVLAAGNSPRLAVVRLPSSA